MTPKPTFADPPITREQRIDLLTGKDKPDLSDMHKAAWLLDYLEGKGWTLYRLRKADGKPRAVPKSFKMTWQIGDECRRLHAQDPTRSCKDIGRELNVDGGRVSEAINGKWMRP